LLFFWWGGTWAWVFIFFSMDPSATFSHAKDFDSNIICYLGDYLKKKDQLSLRLVCWKWAEMLLVDAIRKEMPDHDFTAPGRSAPQPFEAVRGQAIFDALAEVLKQQGNAFHSAGQPLKAITCYTRGLGLACGADLRIALLLNRSLNYRKGGQLEAAQTDARLALSLPNPPFKAKYRLIESLVGSGLLRQAETEMMGSQDGSLKTPRTQIAALRKKVRYEGGPPNLMRQKMAPLFADLNQRFQEMQRNSMHHMFSTNNRTAAWGAITVAYRSCPLLVLMHRFLQRLHCVPRLFAAFRQVTARATLRPK